MRFTKVIFFYILSFLNHIYIKLSIHETFFILNTDMPFIIYFNIHLFSAFQSSLLLRPLPHFLLPQHNISPDYPQ